MQVQSVQVKPARKELPKNCNSVALVSPRFPLAADCAAPVLPPQSQCLTVCLAAESGVFRHFARSIVTERTAQRVAVPLNRCTCCPLVRAML